MAEHNEKGHAGEKLAVQFLEKEGYNILETNWRFRKAEVDIIAEKDEYIIFVEVKTRSTNNFGEPELFVKKKKQQMMILGADEYMKNVSDDKEGRFDVIGVILSNGKYKIHHIEEAFYPGL